jgi:type II secretory pathway component GspD/PulD (secretin)
MSFDTVSDYLHDAKAITWDTCHKIYVLMDEEQVQVMREYEYEPIITRETASPNEMLTLLKEWYEQSCGLRFISAVETNHADPNAGFTNLISQFENEEEEE